MAAAGYKVPSYGASAEAKTAHFKRVHNSANFELMNLGMDNIDSMPVRTEADRMHKVDAMKFFEYERRRD